MDEKHIANGDVDFDSVITLEPYEKTKYDNYNPNPVYVQR